MSQRVPAASVAPLSIALAWLGLVHCGSDSSAPPNGTPMSDAATGDAQAADSPSDGGGDGDAATNADADADAAPSLHQCAPQDLDRAIGTVNGAPIAETWDPVGVAYVSGAPWFITNTLRSGGREHIRGVGQGAFPGAPSETLPFDFAFVYAPSSSAYAKQVVCLGSGALVRANNAMSIGAKRAKVLGACPGGTPLTGELELCQQGSLNCPSAIAGTLTGATFDGAELAISGDSADPTVFGVNVRGRHFHLSSFSATPDPASGAILPIEGVFASLPKPGGAGAIYCLGAGSVVEWAGPNGTRVTIKNATKLGDCGGTDPGGDDVLVLCR